jgi:hypothetical protein
MVETVGIHQVMWFVMFESAKDRVIGVDTLGQQVPPCVRYGMACILIRDVVGSVPCSNEWEFGVVTHPVSHGARGVMCHTQFLRPKPDAHRMYAQDQIVIHTVRM